MTKTELKARKIMKSFEKLEDKLLDAIDDRNVSIAKVYLEEMKEMAAKPFCVKHFWLRKLLPNTYYHAALIHRIAADL